MTARWKAAQNQLRALDDLRSTARITHGELGFHAPPENYWDDNPDHYRPGWQLWRLTYDSAIDDLLLELEERARPPRWRYWRVTKWLTMKAYTVGISAGGGYAHDRWGSYVCSFIWAWRRDWRGERHLPPYILGWPSGKWRCVLRYRHWPYWPDGMPVAFGHCGRCVPWQCCGSIERDHAAGCAEVAR